MTILNSRPSTSNHNNGMDTPVSLVKKGDEVSLAKKSSNLQRLRVEVGWEEDNCPVPDPDLDVSLFLLTAKRKVRRNVDFIFYHNETSACGSVVHQGDVKGGGVEVIDINLETLPPVINYIPFVVTINDADIYNITFGDVAPAYIKLINDDTNEILAMANLSDSARRSTAMLFGEIQRKDRQWSYSHIEQDSKGGLRGFCNQFGVSVADD